MVEIKSMNFIMLPEKARTLLTPHRGKEIPDITFYEILKQLDKKDIPDTVNHCVPEEQQGFRDGLIKVYG